MAGGTGTSTRHFTVGLGVRALAMTVGGRLRCRSYRPPILQLPVGAGMSATPIAEVMIGRSWPS